MSKWVQVLAVSFAVPASLVHCVGDESSLDGGTDGAVDVVGSFDAASLDAPSSDASDASDAAPVACDLSKPFDAPAAFDVVNSDQDEGSFRLSADGTHAYFARGSQASSSFQVYVATKAGAFADGVPLAGVNASSGITADPTVTADELEIFFETTDASGDAGPGYFHVWRASRTQTSMDFESRAPLSVLVGVNAGAPYLSSDGNTLYFQSYDDGTIKASARVSGAQFAAPTVQVSGGAPS